MSDQELFDDQPGEVRVQCRVCRTSWIGFRLPMPVDEFVRQSNALRCPQCAVEAQRIFIWPPHKLTKD